MPRPPDAAPHRPARTAAADTCVYPFAPSPPSPRRTHAPTAQHAAMRPTVPTWRTPNRTARPHPPTMQAMVNSVRSVAGSAVAVRSRCLASVRLSVPASRSSMISSTASTRFNRRASGRAVLRRISQSPSAYLMEKSDHDQPSSACASRSRTRASWPVRRSARSDSAPFACKLVIASTRNRPASRWAGRSPSCRVPGRSGCTDIRLRPHRARPCRADRRRRRTAPR